MNWHLRNSNLNLNMFLKLHTILSQYTMLYYHNRSLWLFYSFIRLKVSQSCFYFPSAKSPKSATDREEWPRFDPELCGSSFVDAPELSQKLTQ